MSIEFQVLGTAGRDNILFVRVNSGQIIHRLLFDCSEGCLHDLSVSEILSIDHLLFSHLHMDHVGGFDSFFRRTFNRASKPNMVWGPPETGRIMHHRFRGFLWNLHVDQPGTWFVHDVYTDSIESIRFEANEAFTIAHAGGTQTFSGMLLDQADFTVETLHMEHLTPSLAYIVREKPRFNIDRSKLAALGLGPGPWLQQVKDRHLPQGARIEIDGTSYDVGMLRTELLIESPGQSLAYLTDFLLDKAAEERLISALQGCTTMICESQYRHSDLELAERNYHMTATQAARLARQANVGRLILFHLSDRYQRHEWIGMLNEAREIFPNTDFPEHWHLTHGLNEIKPSTK
jgi:ribonuclease Z